MVVVAEIGAIHCPPADVIDSFLWFVVGVQSVLDAGGAAISPDICALINPDSMRPVDFANNQVMFETGLPVEGIGASNPMGIEPNQMMGSISRGDMFAAANELRSDNRF